MSEQTSYRCDICNIEKQESNHWWKGYIFTDEEDDTIALTITPWAIENLETVSIFEQSKVKLPKPDAHLCGEAHAIEWASRNLAKK